VTILPFLAIAFGAGAASLLTRENGRLSAWIGIVGLAGAAVAAAAMSADGTLSVGGGELVGSTYLRLFTVLGSVVGLLLALIGLATLSHRHAPGAMLAGMGAAGLALAVSDARTAVVAATAGGLVGIVVTVVEPATGRAVVVAMRELRALAVAGVLAILAAAWIGRPLVELAAEPAVFGLAYLGFAVAVAIRFGAIPFHFWAARLADAAPEVTLPMLMAWSPAAFAVVALAWADASIAPMFLPSSLPLTTERAIVVAIGAVSVILGSLAALIQDDLEHVVGYTIIADAGVAILGLAALDPAAWEPARAWILIFVTVRSAFAAWAVAVRGAFGTRRIAQLQGWAVRAPLLAVALVLIGAGSIGWPGFVAWEARAKLMELTLTGPLLAIVMVGALVPAAIYVRLLMVGVGRPSASVKAGSHEIPRWPAPLPARPMVGQSDLERTFEKGSHLLAAVLDIIWAVPAALRLNRTVIAGILVVALSGLGVVIAYGGLGVIDAARAAPGEVTGPNASAQPGLESEPPGSGPSFQPVPTPP
jgi:formate hydrogenlyase subunit 3/multisubunit Na+/H+ antiporter MnhD subunit